MSTEEQAPAIEKPRADGEESLSSSSQTHHMLVELEDIARWSLLTPGERLPLETPVIRGGLVQSPQEQAAGFEAREVLQRKRGFAIVSRHVTSHWFSTMGSGPIESDDEALRTKYHLIEWGKPKREPMGTFKKVLGSKLLQFSIESGNEERQEIQTVMEAYAEPPLFRVYDEVSEQLEEAQPDTERWEALKTVVDDTIATIGGAKIVRRIDALPKTPRGVRH
jgi:hypothetical protein